MKDENVLQTVGEPGQPEGFGAAVLLSGDGWDYSQLGSMVALVLASESLRKFGGDSMADVRANLASYRERTAARFAPR